jgi:hypothetical protein
VKIRQVAMVSQKSVSGADWWSHKPAISSSFHSVFGR